VTTKETKCRVPVGTKYRQTRKAW